MEKLSDKFCYAIREMGMHELKHPIFYNASIGIRFEIGGDESVYLDMDEHITNPKYVLEALNRAHSIYKSLPQQPDILRIDVYQSEDIAENEIVTSFCKETGLPIPHEIISVPFQWEDDDDVTMQLQFYWNLRETELSIPTLLEKIIQADIGGCNALASSVFFINTEVAMLYHLYDDRGADLAAKNTDLLYPIFLRFNDWIFEYDREQINSIFRK